MPKFLIEREVPGFGNKPQNELREIATKALNAAHKLGPDVQWVETYVTLDKVYTVFIAPNEDLIRQHGKQLGLPVTKVSEIVQVIDPTFAETPVGQTTRSNF